MTCHCPLDLTFPWQLYLDRHVFRISIFAYFKIKKMLFCSIFRSFYGVFIRFNHFCADFGRFFLCFGQIQKFKMAGQDGRHSEMLTQLLRHVTYYVLLKSHCYSYLILGVTGEEGRGGGQNPPPGRRRPKKARSK